MKAVLPLALSAACLLLPAQTKTHRPQPKPASAESFPLRRIEVKGNKLLTASQIQDVAGLPLNKPLGKADFDAARDRLLATGYFESVAFQFQATQATFDVIEVPSVYPVQFENLPLPTPEIETGLKAQNVFYGPKLPGTQQVLAYYTRQIEQLLAAHNHPERVIGELVPSGGGDFHILFRSGEPLPPVAFVTFTGNKAISSIALQNAINDVAFGAPFSRDHFRQLLDNQIRPLYDAKGLIRVAFPMFTTEPAPKVKGVLVHVMVEEGPVYKLGKLSLDGADPDFLDSSKFKSGDTVNFDELNEAMLSVQNQLKRNGYLEASGLLTRKIDDKAHTVNVAMQMTPGAQYVMGALTITGLDLNSEPVVRKLWIVEEGKPFNALYPDYFLKRIRDDGLFDGLGTTKSVLDRNDATHIVNVTLVFGSSPRIPERKRPSGYRPP